MTDEQISQARERLLEVATRLFGERGYKGVTLRDIAEELNIKKASLYHHVPGGKEALFIEVTERGFEKHRVGLENAIAEAGDDLRAQLQSAARWLISQAPMDFSRMIHSDMPSINPEHTQRLMWMGYQSLLVPIENIFKRASLNGEIRLPDPQAIAGSFLAIVEGLHQAPGERAQQHKAQLIDEMIDVLLYGVVHR